MKDLLTIFKEEYAAYKRECEEIEVKAIFLTTMSLIAIFAFVLLSGCTAQQRTTETFKRDKDGNIVKVTKTITETVKEEKRVPDYHVETRIHSATKTTGGTQPLHKAEVLSGDAKSPGVAPGAIPEPVKTP